MHLNSKSLAWEGPRSPNSNDVRFQADNATRANMSGLGRERDNMTFGSI